MTLTVYFIRIPTCCSPKVSIRTPRISRQVLDSLIRPVHWVAGFWRQDPMPEQWCYCWKHLAWISSGYLTRRPPHLPASAPLSNKAAPRALWSEQASCKPCQFFTRNCLHDHKSKGFQQMLSMRCQNWTCSFWAHCLKVVILWAVCHIILSS